MVGTKNVYKTSLRKPLAGFEMMNKHKLSDSFYEIKSCRNKKGKKENVDARGRKTENPVQSMGVEKFLSGW